MGVAARQGQAGPGHSDRQRRGSAAIACEPSRALGKRGVQPHPAVAVIQHADGVGDFARTMTDRVAAAGYLALAADLYRREEPNSTDDPIAGPSAW